MSRRKPGQQPQATLTHPNDPSIKVTVRKPLRSEGGELAEILSESVRAMYVYDKDGQPAVDDNGNKVVHVEQMWPYAAQIAATRGVVVSWEGILSDNEQPIVLSADKANVGELFEEWLDVELDEPVANAKPGEPATRKVSIAFGRWINRECAKPETFAPLQQTSVAQSI